MTTLQDKEYQDSFEIELENQIKVLKSCQEEKSYNSCMSCDSYINCPTRKTYVKTVYGSMSKGQTGGFEF